MNGVFATVFSAIIVMSSQAAHGAWESLVMPKGYEVGASLDDALLKAKEQQKWVIVYYTRSNCPPCNYIQGHLKNEAIKRGFADDFVFTVVWGNGMDTSKREDYRTRYGVIGAPTWIIFDSKGEYICTANGGFNSYEAGLELSERLRKVKASASAETTTVAVPCSQQ